MNQQAEKAVQSGNSDLAYAWNFLADLGSSKQFSLTGSFPKGMTANDMNAEVDKIRAVFDRQQAKSAVLSLEQEIAKDQLRLNGALEDLERIDAKHEAKGGPSTQEKAQRESAVVTVTKMSQDLDHKKALLEKIKEEAK